MRDRLGLVCAAIAAVLMLSASIARYQMQRHAAEPATQVVREP